jgi:hypothetical protein
MPFKSEKQRRFLWAEHPDIAKRWADEYPNQKKLPMYAHKTNSENSSDNSTSAQPEKEAAMGVLKTALARFNSQANQQELNKTSESILKRVSYPSSNKPVAAGDSRVTAKRETIGNTGNPAKKQQSNLNVLKLFNLQDKKDCDTPSAAQKIAQILEKFAVDIRLGKNHQPQDYQAQPSVKGINIQQIQQAADQAKATRAWEEYRNRVYGAPEQPKPAKSQAGPVASYAGTKPDKSPNVMSNQLAGNTIGKHGPMTSHNGVPTQDQNVTGNASFGQSGQIAGTSLT